MDLDERAVAFRFLTRPQLLFTMRCDNASSVGGRGCRVGMALVLVAAFGNRSFIRWVAMHPRREPLEDLGRVVSFPQWWPLPPGPGITQPWAMFVGRSVDPRRGGIGVLMVGWLATALAAGLAGAVRAVVAVGLDALPLWALNSFPPRLVGGGRFPALLVAEASYGGRYGLACGWLVGLAALAAYRLTRPARATEPAAPWRAGASMQAGLLAALTLVLVLGNPVLAQLADRLSPTPRFLVSMLSFAYWQYRPDWLHGNPHRTPTTRSRCSPGSSAE